MDRIASHHRQIDDWTAEISVFERIIDENRAMYTWQQEYNVEGWQRAKSLRQYADLRRSEGDILCMQGINDRELNGNHSAKHANLLAQVIDPAPAPASAPG